MFRALPVPLLAVVAVASSAQYGHAVKLANLADTGVSESSGLAASLRDPRILWTHNDSGNPAILYATNRQGHPLARVTITGATNVDWEDMAEAPGPVLWIADFGDNALIRTNLCLYRVTEPLIHPTATNQTLVAAATRFPFSYPDGFHDAEALLVHPVTGDIYVVTKHNSGVSRVYRFPQPMTPTIPATLEFVTTLTFTGISVGRRVTGGDIRGDGARVLIRTYLFAYEWFLAPGQSLASALAAPPAHTLTLPFSQGEAVAYSANGRDLLFTSEGIPCPLGVRPGLRLAP